ncbi:hypothetical protein [Flavobacterium sp.]|uniref:hypothetical protein n=1 Tax=Flavobacterium sp. TaxID=239 RepID=UPI004033A33F
MASLVVEDTYYSEGWSMADDAPWSITFSKNDSDGLQATFEGVIMNGGSERVVTDGLINITYGDDNYVKAILNFRKCI